MTTDVYRVQAEDGFLQGKNLSLRAAPADRPSTDSAPISKSDLIITGVTWTGTNAGYVYVGDYITCTGYSSPPPATSSYYWTDQATGQVIRAQMLIVTSAGTTTGTCTASNVVNSVSYSATTDPFTITACNLGYTCHGPNNTAARNTSASIVLIAAVISFLRCC